LAGPGSLPHDRTAIPEHCLPSFVDFPTSGLFATACAKNGAIVYAVLAAAGLFDVPCIASFVIIPWQGKESEKASAVPLVRLHSH